MPIACKPSNLRLSKLSENVNSGVIKVAPITNKERNSMWERINNKAYPGFLSEVGFQIIGREGRGVIHSFSCSIQHHN
ncbi:hypothetical protein CDL12_16265 [Handroanthus impetiginosus]|uniref:Uncharacterized protein n=1 Tax=Handroanthus impetiginosus TaxID=429701 RepID=A0A2G9H0T5_9LAMI|nr:hypothetical protein CDL12_16265 [Handroanthus impetiginosus]